MYNPAGLGGVTHSPPILLDHSAPTHANVTGCTLGGNLFADGVYYQKFTENLTLCWDSPGFVDSDSGIWRLEVQISRLRRGSSGLLSRDGSGLPNFDRQWDVIRGTEVLPYEETRNVLRDGQLVIRSDRDSALDGGEELFRHNNWFRVGLRAINRAGLRSCPPTVSDCKQQGEGDWSVVDGYYDFMIDDDAADDISRAEVWLCDPRTPLSGRPCHDLSYSNNITTTGQARGGFQASNTSLHVQWKGFTDGVGGAGLAECELTVYEYLTNGGKPLLGECWCNPVMHYPRCNCDRVPDNRATQLYNVADSVAHCDRFTENIRDTFVQDILQDCAAQNRTTIDRCIDPAQVQERVDDLRGKTICFPGEPLFTAQSALGRVQVSDECESDLECDELPHFFEQALMSLANASYRDSRDRRVVCVSSSTLPWQDSEQPPPAPFCCARSAQRVCMPVALLELGDDVVYVSDIDRPASMEGGHSVATSRSLGADGSTASGLLREDDFVSLCLGRGAIPVQLTIVTGSDVLAGVHPWFSHLGWNIDGELTAPHGECDAAEGCGASRCAYRPESTYKHSVCLSPGRHRLTLSDASGFGWSDVWARDTAFHLFP